ncbi:peptidoglycan-recognition protein LA isoform X2 [Bactrocera neohumeralis]|uniref:peptidoglycan-recognition protein LA isoform X2 n=1 Tax=Bactrocera neohumeralis TaxID=98809 RepID=UPI002166A9D4|nr:peptidoglycan-recognition protein LA isoform X2 [Bactrocera neohumeralis]
MDEDRASVRSANNHNPLTSAANNALWSLQGNSPGHPVNRDIIPSVKLQCKWKFLKIPAAIPQNIFANPAIQPSSVINLSNSSDVVIGPMTQYQGPVTIYQYMDATVEARSTQAGGGINQNTSNVNTSVFQKLSTSSKLLLLLIVVVIIVAVVIIYIQIQQSNNQQPGPIVFGNTYEHGTFPNLGNGHLVIDREQWGASELSKTLTIPLKHPIPYVIITHIGVQSKPCETVYKCSIKMRTIQDSAIAEKNLPDIQANFYVGDDGNIYVGRGWDYANTYANDTLAVTFMGDYGRYEPSQKQLEAAQYLLSYAIANKYIDLGYKLVAQNQTKVSKSPGANVYRQIKKWPHFYPCGIGDNKRCGVELNMPDVWDGKM